MSITARVDGSTNPVVFKAPDLEVDLELSYGPFVVGGTPDPDAPAILSAPLCSP